MYFLKKTRAKNSFLKKIWFYWGSFSAYIQKYRQNAELNMVGWAKILPQTHA